MHGRFRVSGVPPESEAPNLHDCRQQAPRAGEVQHFRTWATSGSEHTLNLYGVYPATET